MKVYSYSVQGKRESNEYQHFIFTNLEGDYKDKNDVNILGVFDGHGGKLVSKYLKENLPLYFIKKFQKNIFVKPEKFSKYTNTIFELVQGKLKEEHPRATTYCGSTACLAIHCVDKTDKKKFLWLMNVGDSRCVLAKKNGIGEQLTKDHKPNSPEERNRIEKLGGKISFDGVDWRVKDLSLSRAFGDLECTPFVTHLPQIYRYKISSGDKFLILACDGLWDVVSNQDAVDFVQDLINKNYKGNPSKALCEYALTKGSMDNVTTIIYFFQL
jgi:serine/threonine protein phosphatase PrpC